jgi:hypothetical protein
MTADANKSRVIDNDTAFTAGQCVFYSTDQKYDFYIPNRDCEEAKKIKNKYLFPNNISFEIYYLLSYFGVSKHHRYFNILFYFWFANKPNYC